MSWKPNWRGQNASEITPGAGSVTESNTGTTRELNAERPGSKHGQELQSAQVDVEQQIKRLRKPSPGDQASEGAEQQVQELVKSAVGWKPNWRRTSTQARLQQGWKARKANCGTTGELSRRTNRLEAQTQELQSAQAEVEQQVKRPSIGRRDGVGKVPSSRRTVWPTPQ